MYLYIPVNRLVNHLVVHKPSKNRLSVEPYIYPINKTGLIKKKNVSKIFKSYSKKIFAT